MSYRVKTTENGEVQLCIWGGSGEPDLNDPSVWNTYEEFEEQLKTMEANSKRSPNEFSPSMIKNIYAKWNAAGSGPVTENAPVASAAQHIVEGTKPTGEDDTSDLVATTLDTNAVWARYNASGSNK